MASAVLIAGIILLLLGIFMIIAGVIWYEINARDKKPQTTFVYVLLIGGVLLAIIGAIMLAVGLIGGSGDKPAYEYTPYQNTGTIPGYY